MRIFIPVIVSYFPLFAWVLGGGILTFFTAPNKIWNGMKLNHKQNANMLIIIIIARVASSNRGEFPMQEKVLI